MPQLTKEHLDKALDKHFKKVDKRFETIEANMATKTDLKKLPTKADLDKRTEELKGDIAQVAGQVEDLAGMVQRRFDEIELKLDVRVRVEKVEQDVRVIKRALHLTK